MLMFNRSAWTAGGWTPSTAYQILWTEASAWRTHG